MPNIFNKKIQIIYKIQIYFLVFFFNFFHICVRKNIYFEYFADLIHVCIVYLIKVESFN